MMVIRMPIISTSIMAQWRAARTARSRRWKPGGRTPRRRPATTYSSAPSCSAGNAQVNRNTISATTGICCAHSTATAPGSVAVDSTPPTSSSTIGLHSAMAKTMAAPSTTAAIWSRLDATPRYSTQRQRTQRAFSRARSGWRRCSRPQSWQLISSYLAMLQCGFGAGLKVEKRRRSRGSRTSGIALRRAARRGGWDG